MYKTCKDLENSLYVAPNEIRACCKRFFFEGKMRGDAKLLNITKNNAQKRSYLDIFEKRMFSSRITMESNIMNREISDYMIGLDALLEADRIEEEMFNTEHDLWEY